VTVAAEDPASAESSLTVENAVTSAKEDLDLIDDATLPGVLLDHRQEYPDEVALRQKEYGIWQEYTWADYYDKVRVFAAGLETLGFVESDIVFTIGQNRPQQLWTWMAAQSLGGMAAPNYAEMLPEDIAKQIDLLEPKAVFAEDQEMVDKTQQAIDAADWSPEAIIYNDPKGLFRYDHEGEVALYQYEDLEDIGRERFGDDLQEGYLADRIAELDPTQTAMLSPTSGTTGMPKRVQLSHFNFVNLANAVITIDPLPHESEYVSYLPMAWVGEQMILIAAAFLGGWTANFPEQEDTQMADLRDIGPETIFASPQTWENWVADVKARIENTTRLKQFVYDKAMAVGERYASYISGDNSDEDPPAWLRVVHWLFYWIAYRPILDEIGIKRAKNVYTGGGPLGEEHFQFFHAMGLPLKQIWGQSEVCGFVTVHRNEDIQADTVGEVFPNVDVGITPEGELLVRGPVVMNGYYNMPEKTEGAIEDGWLHTDDFGALTEDDHVKVFDRMDDVIELADETAVAPISVETKLKFNPYVKEAMVVGEDRDYLGAILNIRFDNVAEWADQRNIQYAGYRDLTQKPEVLELMRGVVAETNEKLENLDIGRFVILFKEFDADDGELTRTGKLRREVVTDRYQSLVDGIYAGQNEVEMDVTITYQDGRESHEHGVMTVVDPAEPLEVAEGGPVDG
jgi:long-chain acyl-CoA synthetase